MAHRSNRRAATRGTLVTKPLEPFKRKQCPAYAFRSRNGKATAWFCILEDGHEGEHRSYRKRWTDSPPDPEAQAHAQRWLGLRGLLGAPEKTRPRRRRKTAVPPSEP